MVAFAYLRIGLFVVVVFRLGSFCLHYHLSNRFALYRFPVQGSSLHDIVISVDPSSVPLSLILICEQLSTQYTVFQSTYVHSSVTGQVPDHLLQFLTSNGGTNRTKSQISVMLVWKKGEDLFGSFLFALVEYLS